MMRGLKNINWEDYVSDRLCTIPGNHKTLHDPASREHRLRRALANSSNEFYTASYLRRPRSSPSALHLTPIYSPTQGEAIPAFLTICIMPLTYSIAYGIIAGISSYIIIQVRVQ